MGALAAWLRRGEIEAVAIDCKPWNAAAFRASLSHVRSLTRLRRPEQFIPKLRAQCAAHGVAVVVVRAPKGSRASGATRFLSPEKALIQLSFRFLSDDQFWFTFFHEAAHLLLHENRLVSNRLTILEGIHEKKKHSVEEDAANRLAEELLFPGEVGDALQMLRGDSESVLRFAIQAGLTPGIVVGQLQHRRGTYAQLNYLKRRYVWSDQSSRDTE